MSLPAKKIIGYFTSPFPSTEGFSSYKSPGLLVHVPLIVIFGFTGYCFFREQAFLWPLILFYLIAGLYLGRTVAILAHYNIFIVIAVWAVFIVSIRYADRLPASVPLTLSVPVTAAILIAFFLDIRKGADLYSADDESAEEDKERRRSGSDSANAEEKDDDGKA